MVYVTSIYDNDLHKEVFKITGEKGYVKSTGTVLTQTAINKTNVNYAEVTFKVDVVGDRDSSNILFYDNGVLIPYYVGSSNTANTVLSWNVNSSETTVKLRLNYNVEHNIRAVYKGNNKCLGSSSNIIKPDTSITTEFITHLTLTCSSTLQYENESFTLTGVLKDYQDNPIASQYIKIYDGNTFVERVSTNSSGTYSLSNSYTDKGVHSFRAVFEKTSNYYSSEAKLDISIGVDLQIIEYSDKWVNNRGYVKVLRRDMFGEPYEDGAVRIYGNTKRELVDGITGEPIVAYTDENGIATFNYNPFVSPSPQSVMFDSIEAVSREVHSETIRVNSFLAYFPELTADTFTAKGQKFTVTANPYAMPVDDFYSGDYADIPIELTGFVNDTLYTNANGVAEKTYIGKGEGDVSITADFGGVTRTVNITDYLQYWRANNTSYNQSYTVLEGRLDEQAKGFKLTETRFDYGACLGLGDGSQFITGDWAFSFDVSFISQSGVGFWVDSFYKQGNIIHKSNNLNSVFLPKATKSVEVVYNSANSQITVSYVVSSQTTSHTVSCENFVGYPCFEIDEAYEKSAIIFDNLKFKVM